MKWTKRRKRVYGFLIVASLLVIFFSVWNYLHRDKEAIPVSFLYGIDGDTVILEIDKKEVKVRLLSVDAPEIGEPYYEESRDFTTAFLKDSVVTVKEESESGKYDKYGRELYWVYADGVLLQEKLLEEGLAEIDYVYGDYDLLDSLKKAEMNAKSQEKGIWSK